VSVLRYWQWHVRQERETRYKQSCDVTGNYRVYNRNQLVVRMRMCCMSVLLRVCVLCWWCWLCVVRCVLCVVGWRCVCLLVQAGQGPTALANAPNCYIPGCTLIAGWTRLHLCVVCCFCCVLCLCVWRCVCLLVQAGQGPTALASAPICYIPACILLAGWARLQLCVVCCFCCVLCLLVGGVCLCVCLCVFALCLWLRVAGWLCLCALCGEGR
jgi:hypothetical protein